MKYFESLITLLAVVWILWKFISNKNLKYLMFAIMLAVFILSRWPLFLPMRVTFGLWGLIAAGFMTYEFPYKKGIKNTSSTVYVYILLFVCFSFAFLAEVFINHAKGKY